MLGIRALLAVFLAAPIAFASDLVPDPVMDHSVPAQPGGTLEIELGSGGTLDLHGTDEPRVAVRAKLGGRDWKATRLSLSPTSDGARLRTWLTGSRDELSTSHGFEIHIPRKYDVRIHSAGGNITIENVEGEFSGSTDGGSIALNHVRGEASLATRGGSVEISDSHLGGWVTTRGGAVSLTRVTGGVQATSDRSETGKGEGKAEARQMDLRGGPIEIDDAPEGGVLRTGSGRIFVKRSGASLDAKTGYGDIEIGPTFGAVKAVTGTGDIRVTLARNLSSKEAVELTSGTGKVTLELPADFDGELDLQTGYTGSYGRPTRIQCDWKLRIESTGLVESGGTPQHYVIGRGAAGKGVGRVVIRTTNGDIVVRRLRTGAARWNLDPVVGGPSLLGVRSGTIL